MLVTNYAVNVIPAFLNGKLKNKVTQSVKTLVITFSEYYSNNA